MLAWQIATAPLFLIIVPGLEIINDAMGQEETSTGNIYRKANIWICFEILWLYDEI